MPPTIFTLLERNGAALTVSPEDPVAIAGKQNRRRPMQTQEAKDRHISARNAREAGFASRRPQSSTVHTLPCTNASSCHEKSLVHGSAWAVPCFGPFRHETIAPCTHTATASGYCARVHNADGLTDMIACADLGAHPRASARASARACTHRELA